ncbi:MAG: energy transducer TonB [Acidobacteria bacterium]|nr:energy transducer TonB [Acidobacteriota bacterium]
MPVFSLAGLLTAVISAALFTVAIVYAVRSRPADIETPLSDLFTGEGFPLERELFSTALLEPRITVGGHLISVLLHVAVLLGTPVLPYLFPDRLNFDFAKYNVKIVEFRIPAPLFYAAPEGPEKTTPARALPRARVRTSPRPKARSPERPTSRSGIQPSTVAALNRPRLELPRSLTGPSKDVVIQPDQPRETTIALPPNLPTAFLWAQGPAPLDISRLVGIPEKPSLPTFSLPHAAPSVQRPNQNVTISELQVGATPVLVPWPPQLPLPVGNVSPVRMPAPPLEDSGNLPATAVPGDNPMNLISLMRNPAPPTAGYLLELGNRLPESPPASSATPAAGAAGENPPKDSTAAAGTNKKEEDTAKTPGRDTASKDSTPAANTPAPAAKGSYADLLKAGAPSGTPPGSANAGAERKENAGPAIRPVPKGNLGVIVVQSSAQDTALEGAEVLTGQPVYTVYFEVPGAPRRWILQYCVPGSETKSFVNTSDGVIRILPKRNVQPPYPLERIPLDVKTTAGTVKRLVVYALVNERGETENIRMIRGTGEDEIDGSAVATLKRWAFRPATRGDTPVAVEALFGIPLE